MGKMLTNYDNLKGNTKEKQEYEASMRQLTVILTFGVLFYYIVPILFMATVGGKAPSLYAYLMVGVYPLFCFMAGFFHGKNHGFVWYVPVCIGLMFVPTVIIFGYQLVNASLGLVYCVLAGFGCFTGFLLKRRKEKKKAPIGASYAANKYATKKKKK